MFCVADGTGGTDLRFRKDDGFVLRLNRAPGRPRKVCRICGCTDEQPCAGGCGWSDVEAGERPICLACAEFREDLEAYVEDGRVSLRALSRLYREVRVRISKRRAAEGLDPVIARAGAA